MYSFHTISILIFNFWLQTVPAQIRTEQDIENYFPNKIRSISAKLYTAGIEGRVKTYFSDSIRTVYNQNEARERGADFHIMQVQLSEDPSDVIDTLYWTSFHTDSLYEDFMISYRVEQSPDNKIIFKPWAVSPIFLRHIMGMEIAVNLFWIDWDEIKTALGPRDQEFLEEYSMWKQFGARDLFTTKGEQLNDVWNQWHFSQRVLVNDLKTSRSLGTFLIRSWKETMITNILSQSIRLYSGSGDTLRSGQFAQIHASKLLLPLNQLSPYPDSQEDTILYLKPEKLDSFSYDQRQKKFLLYQKLGGDGVFITYTILESDVRKIFSESYWYMLQSAIRQD